MEGRKKRQKLSPEPQPSDENLLLEGLRVLCRDKKLEGIPYAPAAIKSFMGPPPRTIAQVCKLNAPTLLRWIITTIEREPSKSLLKLPGFHRWQFDQGMENAVIGGHLEMVKTLDLSFPCYSVSANVVETALSHARLEILRWLFAFRMNSTIEINSGMLTAAAQSGDLETVKWAYARCTCKKYPGKATDEAVASGNLEVLKWLLEQADTYVDLSRAASNGHFHVIEWMLANRPGKWIGANRVVNECACRGKVDLTRSLLRYNPDKGIISAKTVDAAAGNGHIETFKWLLTLKEAEGCTRAAMDNAAGNGHLEVVKWLHETISEGRSTDAMDYAATNGHLEIVQWLHYNREEGCTIHAANGAATNGFLEVVVWLLENRLEGCSTDAMDGAAGNGHLHVVKWLHEHRTEGCTNRAVCDAAEHGHLAVIEWLHDRTNEDYSGWGLPSALKAEHFDIVLFYLESGRRLTIFQNRFRHFCTWKFLDWLISHHQPTRVLPILEGFRNETL